MDAQTNALSIYGNHLSEFGRLQMLNENQSGCGGFMAMCVIPTHCARTLYHAKQLEVNRRSCLGVMHQQLQVFAFVFTKVDVCVCVCMCVAEINIGKYVM
jgi:hypothetical protein